MEQENITEQTTTKKTPKTNKKGHRTGAKVVTGLVVSAALLAGLSLHVIPQTTDLIRATKIVSEYKVDQNAVDLEVGQIYTTSSIDREYCTGQHLAAACSILDKDIIIYNTQDGGVAYTSTTGDNIAKLTVEVQSQKTSAATKYKTPSGDTIYTAPNGGVLNGNEVIETRTDTIIIYTIARADNDYSEVIKNKATAQEGYTITNYIVTGNIEITAASFEDIQNGIVVVDVDETQPTITDENGQTYYPARLILKNK